MAKRRTRRKSFKPSCTNAFDEAKKIMSVVKRSKHWHHDIKYIDGVFVEDVVVRYQSTGDEQLLVKIIENWSVFRHLWAAAFAKYLDNDLEAGGAMHDNIIWKNAQKFDFNKAKKSKGQAFNAFIVSSLMNQLKNFWNARNSRKNTPRVSCPICGEEVVSIDAKHLSHIVTMERYKKQFPAYPLVSTDGFISSPLNHHRVQEITESHVLKAMAGPSYYTVEDYKREYADQLPRYPVQCPVTGVLLEEVTIDYPATLMKGYTEIDFITDFGQWEGIINCPITKSRILQMSQERLDKALGQTAPMYGMKQFLRDYPKFTMKAKQVRVMNPYTDKLVFEITPEMLREAGTTVKEHLEKYATIILGQHYKEPFFCPFTGKKMNCMTKEDLARIGRTVQEFYQVTCKYPLRKFLVRCAIDGEWVENIWSHLQTTPHPYAQPMTAEEFETTYGAKRMKAHISNNSYVETENGDTIHVADLLGGTRPDDYLEIEDSLLKASCDDFDKRIARSIRNCNSMDDICHSVAKKVRVNIPMEYKTGMSRNVKALLESKLKHRDFDIWKLPAEGHTDVEILVPSKNTISKRLTRMIKRSDLNIPKSCLNELDKSVKPRIKNRKKRITRALKDEPPCIIASGHSSTDKEPGT